MDTQIDYAAGMPIGLLDEMPTPVDATESIFRNCETEGAATSGSDKND